MGASVHESARCMPALNRRGCPAIGAALQRTCTSALWPWFTHPCRLSVAGLHGTCRGDSVGGSPSPTRYVCHSQAIRTRVAAWDALPSPIEVYDARVSQRPSYGLRALLRIRQQCITCVSTASCVTSFAHSAAISLSSLRRSSTDDSPTPFICSSWYAPSSEIRPARMSASVGSASAAVAEPFADDSASHEPSVPVGVADGSGPCRCAASDACARKRAQGNVQRATSNRQHAAAGRRR